jgi:hypothetical protein
MFDPDEGAPGPSLSGTGGVEKTDWKSRIHSGNRQVPHPFHSSAVERVRGTNADWPGLCLPTLAAKCARGHRLAEICESAPALA